MRAMILAAGHGRRMRPLTDHMPKPLLTVKDKPLITYHLEALVRAGITEIVINLGVLGNKIEEALGSGDQFGAKIHYSYEDPPLETGGGIAKVLSWLGPDPFIAISADILTAFPFERLPKEPKGLAHLVLVDNPPHHLKGDYALVNGAVCKEAGPLFNFGGIGVYRPEFFTGCPEGIFPLYLLFEKYILEQKVTGEYYSGMWHNIGTPEQLKMLNQRN